MHQNWDLYRIHSVYCNHKTVLHFMIFLVLAMHLWCQPQKPSYEVLISHWYIVKQTSSNLINQRKHILWGGGGGGGGEGGEDTQQYFP